MTSTKAGLRGPLYLFAKPPVVKLPEFKRLRAMFGIESRYALDRLHSTLLMLGESNGALIETARDALSSFHAEPFEIVFDHIDGATLKPRKGLRAPRQFHRALVRHFAISGMSLPDYSFSLHLNLDYPPQSNRRASIPPLAWTVDEILLIESVPGRHIVHGHRSLMTRQYALAL